MIKTGRHLERLLLQIYKTLTENNILIERIRLNANYYDQNNLFL